MGTLALLRHQPFTRVELSESEARPPVRPSVRPSVYAIHTLITGDTEGCFNIESIVGQMSNFEKDVMDTIV
jgi:hypothetical protein